jgi:hypothetical protein
MIANIELRELDWTEAKDMSDEETVFEIGVLETLLSQVGVLGNLTSSRQRINALTAVLRKRHKQLSDEEFRVWLELNG